MKTKDGFSSETCEDKTTRIFLCFAFCSALCLCLDYDLMLMLMLMLMTILMSQAWLDSFVLPFVFPLCLCYRVNQALMIPSQIIAPPPSCCHLILLCGVVPLSSQPLIQPSGPSRVSRDSSVNNTCSKFVFMYDLAQSKRGSLCLCFSGGLIVGFAIFPRLLKILHRPALDLEGAPASANILELVEWGFFDKTLFTELISRREIFRNLPLSDLPLTLLVFSINLLTVRWSRCINFEISKLVLPWFSISTIFCLSSGFRSLLRPILVTYDWCFDWYL